MSARTRAWFGLPVLLGLSTLLVASFSCNPVKAKPLATPAEAFAAPQPAAAPALPPAPQAGPFADQMAACEQRPFTAQKVSCQISTVAASVHDSLVSIKVRKRLRPQSGPSLLDQLFAPHLRLVLRP